MKYFSDLFKKSNSLDNIKDNSHKRFSLSDPFFKCVILAFFLNLIMEMLCRRSVTGAFVYMAHKPMVFLYNMLIILLTLSISLFLKKRTFLMYLISLIWLSLAITNFVLLGMRTTPLSWIDFQILMSALGIINTYVTSWQLAAIIISILSAFVLAGVIWKKSVKVHPHYIKAGIFVVVIALTFTFSTVIALKADVITSDFPSLSEAYENYGFVYCFSLSIIDRGIDKPEDYSQDEIVEIKEKIGADCDDNTPVETPNIIFVQVESFFDVNRLNGYVFSEDPIPFWSYLRANYPGGLIEVPSIGAGTANTEFEVLSGMSLDYFGASEYPYKTILKTSTCETIGYNLKSLGYSTHAIHNHTAQFYDRNFIYTHIGFDTFTPVEYMSDVSRNYINWANDSILPGEIMKTLASTDSPDFVFTITVQAHGKYPDVIDGYDHSVEYTCENGTDTENGINHNALTYYINELRKSDEALRDLVSRVEASDEKTVIVMYGDHLPALGFSQEDMNDGTLLQTEYVIWSNFDLNAESTDLSAYQLNSHVLELLGINTGIINKLHQNKDDNPDYQHDLEALEYDMLYGDKYSYNDGTVPYNPTNMKLGIDEIEITSVKISDRDLYVFGNNFTEFSKIKINSDLLLNTIYVNSHTLMVMNFRESEFNRKDSVISVAQYSTGNTILSESLPVTYSSDNLAPSKHASVNFVY